MVDILTFAGAAREYERLENVQPLNSNRYLPIVVADVFVVVIGFVVVAFEVDGPANSGNFWTVGFFTGFDTLFTVESAEKNNCKFSKSQTIK